MFPHCDFEINVFLQEYLWMLLGRLQRLHIFHVLSIRGKTVNKKCRNCSFHCEILTFSSKHKLIFTLYWNEWKPAVLSWKELMVFVALCAFSWQSYNYCLCRTDLHITTLCSFIFILKHVSLGKLPWKKKKFKFNLQLLVARFAGHGFANDKT